MIVTELAATPEELAAATGWHIEDRGACNGDVCVPLTADTRRDDGRIALDQLAGQLAMPLVAEPAAGVWALGPASLSGRALVSALAPELTLPTLDGDLFSLSSLRGRKVCLVTWSPY